MTLTVILTIIYVVSVPLSAIEVSIQKDGQDWGWGFFYVFCPVVNTLFAVITILRFVFDILEAIFD